MKHDLVPRNPVPIFRKVINAWREIDFLSRPYIPTTWETMGSIDTSDIDAQIAALVAEKEKKLRLAAIDIRRREAEQRKILIASTPGKKAKCECRHKKACLYMTT